MKTEVSRFLTALLVVVGATVAQDTGQFEMFAPLLLYLMHLFCIWEQSFILQKIRQKLGRKRLDFETCACMEEAFLCVRQPSTT